MWTQKLRQVLAIVLGLIVLCATLWLSFWIALGFGILLAVGYVVNLITHKPAPSSYLG